MRAISTVIASVLILMITIALGGTTYLFISGTFTSKTTATFEVVDSVNDTVTIRNSGTGPIASFSSAKIDGNDAVYRVSKQDSSLVGYWKMDESSWINDCSVNTVIDSSDSNPGRSCPAGTGPTGGATGKFGNAGSFDGIDGTGDHINIGNPANLNLPNTLTITAWVWMNPNPGNPSTGKWAYIWGKGYYNNPSAGNRLSFGFHPSPAKWWLAYDTASMSFGTTNLLNQWVFLAITYDKSLGSANWKTYENGIPKETATWTTGGMSNTYSFYIGSSSGDSRSWLGKIDEVKIFNRVLSEQEIKSEFNIGSQINSGETATMKIYNLQSKGTRTLRLCTSSMCNTAILTIN